MSILETFADEDTAEFFPAAAVGGGGGPVAAGSASAGSAAAGGGVAPRKRGRPAGTTGSRLERQAAALSQAASAAEQAAAAAARSRSSICSAAATARWVARRARVAPPEQEPEPEQAMVAVVADPPEEQAIVAFDGGALVASQVPFAVESLETWLPPAYMGSFRDRVAASTWTPPRDVAGFRRELQDFNAMARMVSMRAATVTANRRKTMTSHVCLLAATVVLAKRFRSIASMQKVHSHLEGLAAAEGGEFKAVAFVAKQKYDEVSLKLRVAERIDPGTGNAQTPVIPFIAKLSQIVTTYACLWKVNGRFLSFRANQPGLIRSIERTTAECMMASLVAELGELQWARDRFTLCTRISVCDDHSANGKADHAIFSKSSWLKLQRYICAIHKESKLAQLHFECFPLEKTGLTHSTLSFAFLGAFETFKRAFKKVLKSKLKRRPYGECGPGIEADTHRKIIEEIFVCPPCTSDAELGSLDRGRHLLARRRLINGEIRNKIEVEHWCPGCCESSEDTYQSICTEIIDPMQPPPFFNSQKWMGAEESIDWHGEWLCTHHLLPEVFEVAFGTGADKKSSKKPKEDEQGDDAGEQGDRFALLALNDDGNRLGEIVAVDELLPEPSPEMSSFERQGTYRKNAKVWYASHPQGRLIALKFIHAIQQCSQRAMIAAIGPKFDVREMQDRREGKPPRPRVVRFAMGDYTTTEKREYGRLVREPDLWTAMPLEYRTHDLCLAAYRATARFAAGLYQLRECRERTYPYMPFRWLGTHGDGRLKLGRTLNHDAKHYLCKMDPAWLYILDEIFPEIRDLHGPRSA